MVDKWSDWFGKHDRSDGYAHPNSPIGGSGTGCSRIPGPLNGGLGHLAHPDSPSGRFLDWTYELHKVRQGTTVPVQRIKDVEVNLSEQLQAFRSDLPDVQVREMFDQVLRATGFPQLSKSFSNEGDLAGLANTLVRIGLVLECFTPIAVYFGPENPEFQRSAAQLLSTWSHGSVREKEDLLKKVLASAARALEFARKIVQSEWGGAKRSQTERQLFEEWRRRALMYLRRNRPKTADEDDSGEAGSGGGPTATPSSSDDAEELHWIQVKLLPRPDASDRPDWWPADSGISYPSEPFSADITNGHKNDKLSGSISRYDNIPAGVCSWKFTGFYTDIEAALKPDKADADAKSLAAPKGGRTYKVELIIERPLMTLKHDNKSNLEVRITPPDATVGDCRIEMKRKSGGDWVTIAGQAKVSPWSARIAGKFKLRAIANIAGSDVVSDEKSMEVQFPAYSDIVGDSDVQSAVNQAWQDTLADCISAPNRRREHGFWINLNTAKDTYEFGPTEYGGWSGPAGGASVNLPKRPGDVPPKPRVDDRGAVYPIASFHTHTPTEFRAAATPPGSTRGIGPSSADNGVDNSDDVPGVVYDFVESQAGSGSIPMGHPKTSTAQLYFSQGKTRRTTPE